MWCFANLDMIKKVDYDQCDGYVSLTMRVSLFKIGKWSQFHILSQKVCLNGEKGYVFGWVKYSKNVLVELGIQIPNQFRAKWLRDWK
jgi:hypothetical protein